MHASWKGTYNCDVIASRNPSWLASVRLVLQRFFSRMMIRNNWDCTTILFLSVPSWADLSLVSCSFLYNMSISKNKWISNSCIIPETLNLYLPLRPTMKHPPLLHAHTHTAGDPIPLHSRHSPPSFRVIFGEFLSHFFKFFRLFT